MASSHLASITVLLLLLSSGAGCQSIGDTGNLTSDSLLKAAEASPDAVTLDIYWARTTLDDMEFGSRLWKSVQEDRIPVELRCRLANEGLRAGVVSGTPCAELVELLNPSGVDLDTAEEQSGMLSAKPAQVTRRLKQLRPGKRLELQAGEVVPTFTLLRGGASGLVGKAFSDAQGMYAVEIGQPTGGQVSLELLPELHHGQPQMKYVNPGPGMVVAQLRREVEVFAELKTTVDLSPGEMLVVTSLPGSKHRLGSLLHHTLSDESPEQKYLLLRLSQLPHTAVLAADENDAWPWK
ncbi:hypothetical protein NG895_05140 [Aeoliella sp. ICT_H6.2]|uniref:Uncharacterized protein n=1 Tax=Aeoliella straminimaris TaxID=2954799 RepID=A0A9X2F7I8_9BACT|nr:hypothetical protein [Aeoliella straminimaris]MCO6043284.1 hypothetical protein [Aeoliella straminimaris]